MPTEASLMTEILVGGKQEVKGGNQVSLTETLRGSAEPRFQPRKSDSRTLTLKALGFPWVGATGLLRKKKKSVIIICR